MSRQGRDTPNIFVTSEAVNDVYPAEMKATLNMMSDPSHLIKKLVNHLFKSTEGSTSRCMEMPDHLVQMILA